MDLLANDLSAMEQFDDLRGFREAMTALMDMRATARRFGREILCQRTFSSATPVRDVPMRQAINRFASRNERRAILSWLDKAGPFWDDLRQHASSEWLECDGELVTDTAVGEAAFRALCDSECGLVSLPGSDWCRSPVHVTWVREAEGLCNRMAEVENWWSAKTLDGALQTRSDRLVSWDDLRETAEARFANLVFSESCFAPLSEVPFQRSAANRLKVLLGILDQLAQSCDDSGARNAEGHHLYHTHFTGVGALFSDSSDTEKSDFRQELTFAHPSRADAVLFCTWHGKVHSPALRLHFSWPVRAGMPVYVVYAGPKITKR